MKKIFKILLIAIPIIIIAIVAILITSHKKTTTIDESLLKVDCTSGSYYEKDIKDMLPRPLKKDSILSCIVSIHSPLKEKFTYDDITFNYEIIGDYEYAEKPAISNELLLFNEKRVHLLYAKERTLNKKQEHDTIYANLYKFKLRILDKEDISDKITFKLTNIQVENNRHIYKIKDYEVSYDIEKDSQ